jgi:hypothetical protein
MKLSAILQQLATVRRDGRSKIELEGLGAEVLMGFASSVNEDSSRCVKMAL